MQSILQQYPLIIVFATIILGFLLGSIQVKGVKLGTSGVLFVGLVLGHYGLEIPQVVQDLGLVLFVLSIGLKTGPRFFQILKNNVVYFTGVALLIVISACLLTMVFARLFDIPVPLAVGLLTGALTSTPGLAAALEVTGDPVTSVGYGLAYPLGVVVVILFIQLVPKLVGGSFFNELKNNDTTGKEIIVEKITLDREELSGKKLEEIRMSSKYGVDITCIKRNGSEFTPGGDTELKRGDICTVTGEQGAVDEVKELFKPEDLKEKGIDLLSFSIFMLAGIFLGRLPFNIPGLGVIRLGFAGGPLFIGLLASSLGRIGPLKARFYSSELDAVGTLGLAMFYAGAGIAAGSGLVEVVADHGAAIFFSSALIAFIPMVLSFILAWFLFKLKPVYTLGAICGGMTSTPGLGALTDLTPTEEPAIAYAAVYPMALIMVAIFAQLLAYLL